MSTQYDHRAQAHRIPIRTSSSSQGPETTSLIHPQSIITLVFFISYIIFQPPSTIIVRKVGPRLHLSAITLLWGAVMIAMGFAKDWKVMSGLRVLLGVLEVCIDRPRARRLTDPRQAGFFPSCVYLLSTWYVRCKCHDPCSCCMRDTDPLQMTSASATPASTFWDVLRPLVLVSSLSV